VSVNQETLSKSLLVLVPAKRVIYAVLGLSQSLYFIIPLSGNIQSSTSCIFNTITVMKSWTGELS